MDLHLSGKTAIVTGGSAGIGLACCKTLYMEGTRIVLAAHEGVDSAAESIRQQADGQRNDEVIPVQVDLSQADQAEAVVQTAIEKTGRVDILVNCAGAARAGAFLELTDQDFLDAWTLKLLGYIRMIKAVIPQMKQQKDGRIINIVGAAAKTPSATFLTGSTANAALVNFTRGISKELAPLHIRINAISPAPTETERARRLAEQTAEARGVSLEKVMEESTKSIPIGRMIKPEEIAALAAFLVSDLAASITGAEILIDGGLTPGV
ncbi:MAG: SDR family oxidoreductase [Desulfobacterales bacterium]|nr:SDR family oxidoreductase [Desulfobacterales bacterium]